VSDFLPHPLAELFPMLSDKEIGELAARATGIKPALMEKILKAWRGRK
jgi:hypothetical protein